MRAQTQKWGDSLAVRIPESVAQEAGLSADADVEMSVRRGSVPTPTRREHTLEELVRGITPENRHEESNFGPPVGLEIL